MENRSESAVSVPQVSVIIPAHNCERFIGPCLDSLYRQTESELEIIVVNDRSSDNTCSLVRELAHRDPRIRLLNNAHSAGASGARNTGIDHASASIVFFLDADDQLPENALRSLLACQSRYDADLVIGSQIHRRNGSEKHLVFAKHDRDIERPALEDYLREYIDNPYGKTMLVHCWGRLYRRSVLESHKLRFNEQMSQFEDLDLNFRYLQHVDHCALTRETVYIYHVNANPQSMSQQTGNCGSIADTLHGALTHLRQLLEQHYPKVHSEVSCKKVLGQMLTVTILRLSRQFLRRPSLDLYRKIIRLSKDIRLTNAIREIKPKPNESLILHYALKTGQGQLVFLAGLIRAIYLRIRYGY